MEICRSLMNLQLVPSKVHYSFRHFQCYIDFPSGLSITFTTTNSHGISTDIKNQPRLSPFALGCHEEDQ